jgi:hypothetical protein
MNTYTPEIGQAMFGQPTGEFEVPDWVQSMFDGIMREVDRVYWNTRQQEFSDSLSVDFGKVHFRPYSWDDDNDAGPNFWHDDNIQRIRWYKHPGRGMSAEVFYEVNAWIDWHDAVMAELRRIDDDHRNDRLTEPQTGGEP